MNYMLFKNIKDESEQPLALVYCCNNHLSQWQMIAQVSKSQSGYIMGSSQENSVEFLV